VNEDEPRLPLIADDSTDSGRAAHEVFAMVEEATGAIPNLYRMLANSPELLEAWIAFAWPLRNAAVADREIRELIIMRTAQLHGSDYEWRQHWRMSIEEGIPEEKLLALATWRDWDAWTEAEQAALAMADEVAVEGEVSGSTWTQLEERFDDRECLELLMTASFYACVSRILNSLKVPLDDSAKELPAVPLLGR
jgi:4-carboxymuconolactone decarboxylase